jgi:hypothetical protein
MVDIICEKMCDLCRKQQRSVTLVVMEEHGTDWNDFTQTIKSSRPMELPVQVGLRRDYAILPSDITLVGDGTR